MASNTMNTMPASTLSSDKNQVGNSRVEKSASAMDASSITAVSLGPNSSERLVGFLEDANLHKKDFAEMIGVTLSYVYSLIDQNVPFSSRTTTLERIAVVMGIKPEDIPEYRCPEEPRLTDSGIEFLKRRQRELHLNNVQFLKRFPRTQRLEIVDMWRGALPMPLDWAKLQSIAVVLELGKEDIYPYWQARLQHFLTNGGIDPMSNIGMLNAMFQGVKAYLKI